MQQVQSAAGTVVVVNTPVGGELALDPGRQVVARVVEARPDGSARISLAGQVLDVTSAAALRTGDEVQLTVTRADATGVRLAIVEPEANTATAPPTSGSSIIPAVIGELAKAGVAVTPQLAQSAQLIADQLAGGAADSSAARAIANLASGDIALTAAAAGRVAAALDAAGSLGPALSSLAAQSDVIADALPAGAPNAAALRSLLSPGLSSSELAIARIVQAAQTAAPGGPTTIATPPAGSNPAVIQNYVTSQLAGAASLDDLAQLNMLMGGATAARASAAAAPAVQAQGTGLAPAALQAALRGQAAATSANGAVVPPAAAPPITVPGQAVGASPIASTPPPPAVTRATAAVATGAANAMPTPTSAPSALAVADLAALATRFAGAVAPGAGAMGDAALQAGRGVNAAAVAQQAGRDGAVGSQAASVAGAGSGGDPVPLVIAVQTFLASAGSQGDAQQLLRTLHGADPAALQTAIRTLPESQTLQLAGQLLDLLPDGTKLNTAQLQELRHGVHRALDDLGKALLPFAADDVTRLRAALEQVAAQDPRPAVANEATRLLSAFDGQQLLSRTATGADPGYVYFQIPMPGGRGAEVMVRREPGRRQVSFDEFNIAFLLDTERIGTLMIQLDAQPASIRADVKTDIPELEPFLRAQAEALIEPLARESRRSVLVTTGVFDETPPTSLLEPQLGLTPGENDFYA